MRDFFKSKAASADARKELWRDKQRFAPGAYLKYVEDENPQRTTLIGKITIYE